MKYFIVTGFFILKALKIFYFASIPIIIPLPTRELTRSILHIILLGGGNARLVWTDELNAQSRSALISCKGWYLMNFQNRQEQIYPTASKTNEDIQSVLSSMALEETCMANEIYASSDKLRTALKVELSDSASKTAWIESINCIDTSAEDALSDIIQKEIASIGKIQKVLG